MPAGEGARVIGMRPSDESHAHAGAVTDTIFFVRSACYVSLPHQSYFLILPAVLNLPVAPEKQHRGG